MGFIQPIGMQPMQNHVRNDIKHSLSPEVVDILKDLGIKNIRAIRIQQGIVGPTSFKDAATITLNHDQKNALQGLGLQGILVAIFAEDDDITGHYKEKLEELHEQLLGKETIDLLKNAFGLSSPPILMEDDNHNGVFLLQQSIAQLSEGV